MRSLTPVLPIVAAGMLLVVGRPALAQAPKTWEVIADKDNTFKVVGQKKAVITVRAGQVVKVKITGRKGGEWDKDGAVHSFTVNDLKDQGWDVRIKEGVQEFTFVAPSTSGEYEIICAVKCGDGHDDMKMKLVVTT